MSILAEFKNGGWPNLILLLLGVGGLALGMVAVVVAAMRSPAGRWLGVATLLVAALITTGGILGVLHGRALVEQVLTVAGLTENDQARIRHAGYGEARSCAEFGLAFALLPLVAGALALAIPPRKREEEPPASFQPPGLPAAAPGPASAATVVWVGLGALALVLLLAAVNVVLIAQELPGHAQLRAPPPATARG